MSDEEENKDTDFEFARETLYDMICKGRDGVEEMLEVAKSSEHPRAYEVLAKLIKDTSDVSNQLMTLHRQKKELEKKNLPANVEPPRQTGDTNVFIGNMSTSELQEMLKDINKPDEKEIEINHDQIEYCRHDESEK